MQIRVVNKNDVVILLLFFVQIRLQHVLDHHDTLLNLFGRLVFVDLLLHFGHLLLVKQFVDRAFFVGPVAHDETKLVHDLVLLGYDFVT
jgi:hypothetical protein